MLFRELQFPLREIKAILDSPDYDPQEALEQQIRLLELQQDRLKRLIRLAQEVRMKGLEYMEFQVFDKTEQEQYAEEVKARWGQTEAYAEYAQRGSRGSGEDLMALFAKLGTLRQLPPESEAVQTAVQAIQAHITDHYYTCTKEIFAGLGQMYVQDERFRQNIDAAGGAGTAEFAAKAIGIYCK